MIMPSQGLVSPQRPVSLLLSHTHHFHSLSEGKTKPHHGADDSDLVFFDIRLDSVTLTEPGLAVLAEFVWMCTFVSTYRSTVRVCSCSFCIKKTLICKCTTSPLCWCGIWEQPPFCSLLYCFDFLKDYFQHSFLGFHFLAIFYPKGMPHYQMTLFRVGAENWVRHFKDKKSSERKFSLRS